MKLTRIIAAAAVLCAALVAPAGAQTYKAEYRLSSVLNKPYPWGYGTERWVNLVRERTNGRINIKVYYGASLTGGDQAREFTALKQGTIDLAYADALNWTPQVRELNLFAMPFLFPDYTTIDRVLAGNLGNRLFEIMKKQGVVPLAWGENGYRELSNSKHAIREPQDLKGLKIRVIGSPLVLETLTALGANPTVMSWGDAQTALSTGAVDGQENPLAVFTAAKLEKVGQKHLTLWGSVYDPLILAVNEAVWKSWTPQDQEIVRQAAIEASKYQVALAREGLSDDRRIKEIESLGVTVSRPSPEQRKAFIQTTKPLYAQWKTKIGADLVDLAEKEIGEKR